MAVKKASVLFIDTLDKMIHFYSNNGASIVHETANYTAKSFENEFYTVFTGIVQDYVRKFPIATDTTVLLPDALIVNDFPDNFRRKKLPFPRAFGLFRRVKNRVDVNLRGI